MKRYVFELLFHINYFEDTEDAEFEVALVEVAPSLGENLWHDEDETMLALVEEIEGETCTHDYCGSDDGKFCRFGYALYEADRSEVDHIVGLWRAALDQRFGASLLGPTIRYRYVMKPEDDVMVDEEAFVAALAAHPPVEEPTATA